jgi:hypothetical protein
LVPVVQAVPTVLQAPPLLLLLVPLAPPLAEQVPPTHPLEFSEQQSASVTQGETQKPPVHTDPVP